MSTDGVDNSKRRFLTAATVAVGAVGTGFVAVPFLKSWSPSAKALAAGAPVEVDFSKLQPGQLMRVLWQKKPIWILNRTDKNLTDLPLLDDKLVDPNSEVASQQPEYIKGTNRSLKDKYLVAIGICTHLGCSPTYRPEVAPEDMGPDWLGGFYCPCHGSKFDLAGRVYKNVPAPTNLVIPPYSYLTDTTLIVGVDEGAA